MLKLSPRAYRHSKCLVSCTYVLRDLSKEARFWICLQKPSILAQVRSCWLLLVDLAGTFVTLLWPVAMATVANVYGELDRHQDCLNNPHANPLSPQLCSTGRLYISCFAVLQMKRLRSLPKVPYAKNKQILLLNASHMTPEAIYPCASGAATAMRGWG